VTFDDVSCLLHLPIEGRILDYNGLLCRSDAVHMMVELSGYDVVEVEGRF